MSIAEVLLGGALAAAGGAASIWWQSRQASSEEDRRILMDLELALLHHSGLIKEERLKVISGSSIERMAMAEIDASRLDIRRMAFHLRGERYRSLARQITEYALSGRVDRQMVGLLLTQVQVFINPELALTYAGKNVERKPDDHAE